MFTWAVVYLIAHGVEVNGSLFTLAMLGDITMVVGAIAVWRWK